MVAKTGVFSTAYQRTTYRAATRHSVYLGMTPLQSELDRLYCVTPAGLHAQGSDDALMTPDGHVRAMVLELARPADWQALSAVWRGVQTDLELPAPAIAVNGVDGYQLWFSLSTPIPVGQAAVFLESLRMRYLGAMPAARVGCMPGRPTWRLPGQQQDTGMWSAFVAPDLAAIFSEEPWLDVPPSPDAQAGLLARLESIRPAAFDAVLKRLSPPIHAAPAMDAPAPSVPDRGADPYQFLLDIMNNPAMDISHRIEAAKALLPYTRDRKGL